MTLFFYSFSWFCTIFTCYPIVKKYLILPALEAEEAGKNNDESAPGDVLPEHRPADETDESAKE